MKISIAMPGYTNVPVGGYNVHYTYANILAGKGHDVTILFPRYLGFDRTWKTPLSAYLWARRTRAENKPLVASVKLDARIKTLLVPDLHDQALPQADALIATGWQTAEALDHAPSNRGKKFYIVYDYEHWMTASPDIRKRIESTFSDRFDIIATSSIVQEMIEKCGGHAKRVIYCGLELENFTMEVAPQARKAMTVGFPARHESFKGFDDAVKTASLLRDRYGEQITVTTFGSRKPAMPDWIHWLQYPSQQALRDFYNEQAVFMLPSHFEGWGLTGVEAMSCGAALVVTDNGGSKDYAIDEQTALVVPPKQPQRLADAIIRLLENEDLRIRMALAGQEKVQQYTWANAGDALDEFLTGAVR